MALKVFEVSKQHLDPTIKMVVAGEPGTGKTRTASTWPNPLYLDLDDGLLSIRDRDVRALEVDSIATLEEVKKGLDQPKSEHKRIFGGQVDTVVIDTLDELAKLVVRERLQAEQKSTMAIQDWGYLGDTMRALVRGFRNLNGVNVIFNVHLKSEEDSETGRVIYKPAIQGAFGSEIAAYVDIAVLLRARTQTDPTGKTKDKVTTRAMQSMPDVQYPWLKDRSGSLPGQFPINFEDDYERLRDLVFGALFRDTKDEALAVAKELAADKPKAKRGAKTKAAEATDSQVADAAATDEDKAEAEAAAAKAAEEQAKLAEAAAAEEAKAIAAELAAEKAAASEAAQAAEAEAVEAEAAALQAEGVLDDATTVDEANAALEDVAAADAAAVEKAAKLEAARAALAEAEAEAAAASETAPPPAPEAETTEPETEPAPADEPTAEALEPEAAGSDPEPEPEGETTPLPDPDPVEEAVTTPKPEPEPEPQAASTDLPACAECGKIVENKDYADLSKIRFKKPLCREHFAAAKKA